jgi:hypothetical protein
MVSKKSYEFEPSKNATLVSTFAASPLLFALLFLFLIVLAIPIKIFSPKTKIFR